MSASSPSAKFAVVLSTVPDEATGESLAHLLLENRVAACVTLIGQGISFFWWQDKVQKESEYLLLIKIQEENFDQLVDLITRHHPYEVPEIIALPIERGYPPYLEWVANETISSED
ncbi:MAG: hypothetical protein B5M54_00850 [Candidatus Aminicenantes bacterium 4484_214]|nr:MAG: hypothetical protein B5M54_00850 [Candidatus Aminicenantes bacterium 4484_214]RLE10997.1 MAG: divalent-cation tolerance protein CutA [Candidatus Aminicenantes bacterium]HDJ22721.1 divalent-cation tolerance protein CutA [Candidatus Aminicenantes bacterium]